MGFIRFETTLFFQSVQLYFRFLCRMPCCRPSHTFSCGLCRTLPPSLKTSWWRVKSWAKQPSENCSPLQVRTTHAHNSHLLCLIQRSFGYFYADVVIANAVSFHNDVRVRSVRRPFPSRAYCAHQGNRTAGTPARKKRPFYSSRLHFFWYAFSLWIINSFIFVIYTMCF